MLHHVYNRVKGKPPSKVKSTPMTPSKKLLQACYTTMENMRSLLNKISHQSALQVSLQTGFKVGLQAASQVGLLVSLNGGTVLYL